MVSNLVFRALNQRSLRARNVEYIHQDVVKLAGCASNTHHIPDAYAGKNNLPCTVLTVKDGADSPTSGRLWKQNGMTGKVAQHRRDRVTGACHVTGFYFSTKLREFKSGFKV